MDIETVILAALRQRVESFEEATKEAQKGAAAPPRAPKPEEKQPDGSVLVELTPTPQGFAHMARTFEAEAKEARELMHRIEEKGLATVVYEAGLQPARAC